MKDFLRKYVRRLQAEFQGRKPSESEFLRAAVLPISVSGFGKCGIFLPNLMLSTTYYACLNPEDKAH